MELLHCESMRKNKSKLNSTAGGLLVLGAGGFHIAWLLWNLFKPRYCDPADFFQLSFWYFGNAIGSILGGAIVTRWQPKNIYYFCGMTTIAGGIMLIVWISDVWIIATGRLISGLSHGIAYLTTMTHVADNVVKEKRGRLISSIHLATDTATFILSIVIMYSYPYNGGIRIEQIVGILAIGFAAMGILFTRYLFTDSRDWDVVEKSGDELKERKVNVSDDDVRSAYCILKDDNIRPLLLMIAVTLVCALSNNLILNTKLIEVTETSIIHEEIESDSELTPNTSAVATVILVTVRYAAGLTMIFICDSFDRKKCLGLAAGLSALSLSITHILSSNLSECTSSIIVIVPGIFAITFQIFVGAGVEPIRHVLISEAFSTTKKYWSIAVVAVVESSIQIAIIGLSFIKDYGFFVTLFIYISIGVVALLTIVLHMKLPETRGISFGKLR